MRFLRVILFLAAAAVYGCGGGGGGGATVDDVDVSYPANAYVRSGDFSYSPAVISSGRGGLVYSISGNPAWLSIDAATGVLSGTAVTGNYTGITISVSDGITTDSHTFSVSVYPWVITKTGHDKCYDNSGAETDCAGTGQDGEYQMGAEPSFTRSSDGIVTDNVNRLMWQDDAAPALKTYAAAVADCAALTLGGYSDWRLPGIDEMTSIIDFSKFNSAVFSVFSNISLSQDYWTSTTDQNTGTDMWIMELGGPTLFTDAPANTNYAVCVRGDTLPAPSYTRDLTYDIVTDNNTGLQWEDDVDPGTETQTDAIAACSVLTLGGYTDWRVPNVRELLTIVDLGHYNPAYDTAVFTHARAAEDLHWTSTVTPFSTIDAWDIDMSNGTWQTDTRFSGLSRSFRCVRGGFSE